MISCEECRKKMVALFDREGREEDDALVSEHLRDCPRCRNFQEEMAEIRQRFVCLPSISLSAEAGQQLMREAESDLTGGKTSRHEKAARPEFRPRKFRRLAWASGLAVFLVIVASSLVCVMFSKKVEALKQELEIARREVALARAEKKLQQAQDSQTKDRAAISSLQFRVQDLEERFRHFSSPKVVSHGGDAYDFPYGPSEL